MFWNYIEELKGLLDKITFNNDVGELYADYDAGMEAVFRLFCDVKGEGKQLFFIGNGGSAAIATHMTADFHKNGGMHTVSLYDVPTITCLGNDYGYEEIFSKQILRLGKEGDLLVAISSSGNSPNIVHATEAAVERGMRVITFSGFDEGNLIHGMGWLNVHVPIRHYGIVESIHNLILQQVVDEILERDGSNE